MLSSTEYYDHWSSHYDEALKQRGLYVKAVDEVVIEWSRRTGASTILDIGCGTGTRLRDILARTKLAGSAVDQSPRMVAQARARGLDACALDIAEPVPATVLPPASFDVVVALWNVLGHIPGRARRVSALKNMASLVRPEGAVVFDVNNRYNAAHYGWRPALNNWLRDWFANETGDFTVQRQDPASGVKEHTIVHLFCLREVMDLCRDAMLQPLEVRFINYGNGGSVRTQWSGQICIAARRMIDGVPLARPY
jgi:SAM-dependent methyltransferase